MKKLKVLSWAVLMLSSGSVFAQSYTFEPSSTGFFGNAVNNSSLVGGFAFHHPDIPYSSPTFLDQAAYDMPRAGVTRRYAEPRVVTSKIYDVNAAGLGAGISINPYNRTRSANLFRFDGGPIDIGILAGYRNSAALAVSDSGWVVGHSYGRGSDDRNDSYSRAFAWLPASWSLLSGTLYPLDCVADSSSAHAVTRDGIIGGECGSRPYLWWYGQGYDIYSWLPERIDFGYGPEARDGVRAACSVSAIANSYAFAVTCTDHFRDQATVSFVSTPSSPALVQVPALGLDASGRSNQVLIKQINNAGCGVGFATGLSGSRVAIKHCNGLTSDLNTPVVNGLIEALDINDTGQILVLQSLPFSYARTGLLTPVR